MVVGKELAKRTITAITAEIDRQYPALAPWQNLAKEYEKGTWVERNFLQVLKDNTRQPFHFDGAPG